MANREVEVELRFAQVSVPSEHFGLAWLGLLTISKVPRAGANCLTGIKNVLVSLFIVNWSWIH